MKNIFVEKFSEKISDKKIVEKIFYREKYIIESNTIKKFSRKNFFVVYLIYSRERIIKEKNFSRERNIRERYSREPHPLKFFAGMV